jgi:hypothetical protein
MPHVDSIYPLSFCVGDVLYNADEKNIGIVLEKIDNKEAMSTYEDNLIVWVWKVYWARDGLQYYTDYSLKQLVALKSITRINENFRKK